MGEAFLWGLLAAWSLVIGALVVFVHELTGTGHRLLTSRGVESCPTTSDWF